MMLQLITTPCVTAAQAERTRQASTAGLDASLMCRREWCNTASRLQNQQRAAENALNLLQHSVRYANVCSLREIQRLCVQHSSSPCHLKCQLTMCRDVKQAQLAAGEEEADRRLLTAALAAKQTRITRVVDTVIHKLHNPQPGNQFVRAIAEALDAGERGITELKQEQQEQYDGLARQVSCMLSPNATLTAPTE